MDRFVLAARAILLYLAHIHHLMKSIGVEIAECDIQRKQIHFFTELSLNLT